MYAVLMFAVAMFKSLSCNHHIQRTQMAGRRNWLALTAAVYKKVEKYDVGYIKIILYSESSRVMNCWVLLTIKILFKFYKGRHFYG